MAQLSNPTLKQLLKEVRLILNQSNPLNSLWSDGELTIYLNDAVAQYFIEVGERNEGQFNATADLDIVANQETVDLPTDFFEARSLHKKIVNGFKILPYRQQTLENYESGGPNSPEVYQPYYFFRGNQLVLRPIPVFNETAGLKLEYTAFPETMIWGGDSITSKFTPIFKELIVMYCVYKAKIKEDLVNGGNNSDKAAAHLAQLFTTFKENVGGRSKFPQFVKPYDS